MALVAQTLDADAPLPADTRPFSAYVLVNTLVDII
jgi:hypothetical protein